MDPWIDPSVADYAIEHSSAPDDLQRRLIAETAEKLGSAAGMQISPDEGVFLEVLTRVSGARHAVEVGTFTGYSALCIARALPDDGTLLCCDVSEEWTAIGRRYWAEAGVDSKIELRIGPAHRDAARAAGRRSVRPRVHRRRQVELPGLLRRDRWRGCRRAG